VPPGSDGTVPAVTLAAAALAGVDEVYRVGGAQAIAAMAYGTQSIRAVDVIVGPGNVYVALAKREVAGVVGIDGFNGPSEVAIVADATAHPQWVAADLLAQAEHGPGGAAVLLTWDVAVADAVDRALAEVLAGAPQRAELEDTLRTTGRVVLVDDVDAARTAIDVLAPEHLELACADAEKLADDVRNAGAIFVGNYAPAALGDYLAGVNHVLPTARTARFASALRVDTFCKHVHVVDVDPSAYDAWRPRWLAAGPDADAMDRVNPLYIPRNHLVEEALTAATAGDLDPYHRLVDAVSRPFDERPGLERYAEPAPDSFGAYVTYCGT